MCPSRVSLRISRDAISLQVEDELTRIRQSETSARNKVTLLERQCTRLNDEAREATENISQLEQLNRYRTYFISSFHRPQQKSLTGDTLSVRRSVNYSVNYSRKTEKKGAFTSSMESFFRQLRTELNKAVQSRPAVSMDNDSSNALLWKQKVELLVNHNKVS